MNYLITFNNTTGYNNDDIHKVIINTPLFTKWWHYLPNTYIVVADNTNVKNITTHIRYYLPQLVILVAKIDLSDTGGLLPQEAWDWINSQNISPIKVRPVSLPTKVDNSYNEILRSLLFPKSPAKL